jgi:hypothetical protein
VGHDKQSAGFDRHFAAGPENADRNRPRPVLTRGPREGPPPSFSGLELSFEQSTAEQILSFGSSEQF